MGTKKEIIKKREFKFFSTYNVLEEFNYVTGGIKSDELILVSGNPRSGKTSLLVNLAVDLWIQGNRVMIISNDLSKDEIDLKINKLILPTNQQTPKSAEKNLYRIDDESELPDPIKDIEYLINEFQLDLMFIDNPERLHGNISNNLIALSKLSRKYQIPIICSYKAKKIINDKNLSLGSFSELLDIQEYIGQIWFVSKDYIDVIKNRKSNTGSLPICLESSITGMFIYRDWDTNDQIDQEVNQRVKEEGGYNECY